ncbi:MAG: flagellar protein FlaG [Leptospiraceae bacterium]|nr:flagellar protein FlaG [Leptospiraceae bacterium]MCB1317196.1 flagellar protein FlaG [Leptospiraceae bacterium]MCB1323384.1 flagellar protein FlaG [Leptospiraceae bacterium]
MEPVTEQHLAEHNGAMNRVARNSGQAVLERIKENQGRAHENGARTQHYNVEDTSDNRARIESALNALDVLHRESGQNTRYQFRTHSESGKLQVALVNYITGEVVEEIPSSKILEFSKALENVSGLIIEKRA